ncbi:MAG: c-type cytochrome [Flavobacteriales bacterium]|nr:c-type cytochrome [Flavobacteriales bacterium]
MILQKHIFSILGSVFLLLASGCQTDEPVPYKLNVPSWFPEMEIPAENQLTKARIEVGRKLFYEPLLSLDSSISCGTCHLQENAFTQELPISLGVDGALGLRNAPTLANIGFAPYFFHDGGVLTLELQSQQPIFSVDEMRFSIAGFLERIENDAEYKRMFAEAYNREPDAFGITRAIASFERTFISATSRFDQFEYQGITDALSEQEKRGRTLFFSETAKCSSCHEPPLFTNYKFENIGLYLNYADSGRARISHLSEDNGKFKVPTVRNVELTAPYMHNGSMQTLEEVVEHFNSGGVNHPNQSEKIQPLNLNQQEKEDLVAFLKTLTDQSFLTDTEISNPN